MVTDDDRVDPCEDAGAVTVVAMHGVLDSTALARLGKLLDALADAPGPIVIDLHRVPCYSDQLLTVLHGFRAERLAGGQPCQLRGIRPAPRTELEPPIDAIRTTAKELTAAACYDGRTPNFRPANAAMR